MDNEERLWELISVKLTGEITADESAELACMLTGHMDFEKLVQSLEMLWQASAHPPGHNVEKIIEKLKKRPDVNLDADLEDS